VKKLHEGKFSTNGVWPLTQQKKKRKKNRGEDKSLSKSE
jgi:hypothetical protein